MNNHFTVTIHDDNGVRQFNVHRLMKKALIYAGIFIFSIIIIAVGTILYLDNSVDAVQDKKNAIEKAYKELEEKNIVLSQNMAYKKEQYLIKKRELVELSTALTEIQQMIGMTPIEEDISLKDKFNLTKITSEQMRTLMRMVPSGSPIEYHGITSKFGYRIHPTLHKKEYHKGTDLKAKMNTAVRAPADGIVEYAGLHRKSGFGRLVILEHNYGFKTLYGHLNKVVIKSKQSVKKGDIIAYTGNSGLSNGPHLHYEIRFMYNVLNPYWFIKWTVDNYNEIFKKEKKVPWQSLVTAASNLKIIKPIRTQLSSQQVPK